MRVCMCTCTDHRATPCMQHSSLSEQYTTMMHSAKNTIKVCLHAPQCLLAFNSPALLLCCSLCRQVLSTSHRPAEAAASAFAAQVHSRTHTHPARAGVGCPAHKVPLPPCPFGLLHSLQRAASLAWKIPFNSRRSGPHRMQEGAQDLATFWPPLPPHAKHVVPPTPLHSGHTSGSPCRNWQKQLRHARAHFCMYQQHRLRHQEDGRRIKVTLVP